MNRSAEEFEDVKVFLSKNPEIKRKIENYIQNEKLEALGRLVSGMAHEINNPLTAVIGYAQLLIESALPEPSKRQLGIIRDQSARCGKIIQDLLGFAGKRKPQLTEMCLQDQARLVIEMCKEEFDKNHISVFLKAEQKPILVLGDSAQIQKALSSLLSNAVHALESKMGERKVEIEVSAAAEEAFIRVKDNGCGIQEKHLSKIYEPFFTTKDVGKGSGLGLSLSYGFVSQHGGSLLHESQWGKGTTAIMALPKIKSKNEQESKSNIVQSPNLCKSILVIEDEQVVSGFVKKILSDRGYEVEAAYDGETAYERLRAKKYDIVFCDYRIPKIDGFKLYEKILEENPAQAGRFIFVTASLHFAEDHGGEAFFIKHGLSYLQKPFTGQELIEMLEKRLQQA